MRGAFLSKDKQQTLGGFIPLGDLALDLSGVPVKAICGDPPTGRHFTCFDQVG